MVGELSAPKPLAVGREPPPLRLAPSPNGANGRPARHQGHRGKAKGKAAGRKAGDRFAVLNAFVDFTMQELSRAEAGLARLVSGYQAGRAARTGQADLARRAGVNIRTVKRTVASLRRLGVLVVVYRGSLRRGPSTYRVRPLTTRKER